MYRSSETSATFIEMLPGNIFCVSLKEGAEIGMAEAKELIAATNAMMEMDSPYRGGVYDVSLLARITEDAQKYLRSGEDIIGTVVGAGIISTSAMGRRLGNIFVNLQAPGSYPLQFFDSPIRAEHWIRGRMKETMERAGE